MYGVMYGVSVDKEKWCIAKDKSYWAFSFGQQMCQKKREKKKSHTQKKCPMGLIKIFIFGELKKGLFLSFDRLVPFIFFLLFLCIEIPWSGLFVCFSTLYTPAFRIPILPIYLYIKRGIF